MKTVLQKIASTRECSSATTSDEASKEGEGGGGGGGDVTMVGHTTNKQTKEQGKIELLSQWMLEG